MTVPMKVRPELPMILAEAIAEILERELQAPVQRISRLEERTDALEIRQAKEGLTRTQGRRMQRAVSQRVHEVAKGLPDSLQQHFANAYGSLKDRYEVPSYLDIPRDRFAEAMRLISTYDGSGRNWWTD